MQEQLLRPVWIMIEMSRREVWTDVYVVKIEFDTVNASVTIPKIEFGRAQ